MTNNGTPNNRLDRLEAMLTSHAEMLNQLAPLMAQVAQVATTTSETVAQHNEILTRIEQQQELNTQAISELAENTNRVLARSAVLDDVLLELHESSERHQMNFERHQQNFENSQRSIEAALNRLEAMVLQIIRRFE